MLSRVCALQGSLCHLSETHGADLALEDLAINMRPNMLPFAVRLTMMTKLCVPHLPVESK